MKMLRNTFTIISEIIALGIFIIWYFQNKDLEPLVGIVLTTSTLIIGILNKLSVRPRLVLHRQTNNWSRSPRGFTTNNPETIIIGVNNPEQYWELNWNYDLEIRNNSSLSAYNIEIEYKNLPPRTYVDGQIGKIEPLISHELRIIRIKIIQNVIGTHIEADNYLETSVNILTNKFIIKLKYEDENGTFYYTNYNWIKDENEFKRKYIVK